MRNFGRYTIYLPKICLNYTNTLNFAFSLDLKLHIQSTDYGNFLANEPGNITVNNANFLIIKYKALIAVATGLISAIFDQETKIFPSKMVLFCSVNTIMIPVLTAGLWCV